MTHPIKVTRTVSDGVVSQALCTCDHGIQDQCHIPTSACYRREERREGSRKRREGGSQERNTRESRGKEAGGDGGSKPALLLPFLESASRGAGSLEAPLQLSCQDALVYHGRKERRRSDFHS